MQQGGVRDSVVIPPVRIRAHIRAGRIGRLRERVMPRAWRRVSKLTHRPAVVDVSYVINDRAGGVRAVGVTVAIVDPIDRARVRVSSESALERRTRPERKSRAVDLRAIGRKRRNATVCASVTNGLVGDPRKHVACHGIDRAHSVGIKPIEGQELAADDEPRTVWGHNHRGNLAGSRVGRPRKQRPTRGHECRELGTAVTAGVKETSACVDG